MVAELATDVPGPQSPSEGPSLASVEPTAAASGAVALAELVAEAVVGVGANGRIVLWNLGAERLLGWTARQVLGQPWAAIEVATHDSRAPALVGEAADEVSLRRSDGSSVSVERTSTSVGDARVGIRLSVLRSRTWLGRDEERLLAETEEARRFSAALLALSQRDPDDVEGFMHAVDELCATALGVDRSSVWGWQGQSLVCLDLYDAHAAVHDAARVINAGAHAAYAAAIRSEQPIVAVDVRTHPSTSSLVEEHFQPFGVRSAIDIPTQFVRESRGVLRVESCRPRHWREAEVRFVAAVATMVVQMCARAEHRRVLAHHSAVLGSIRDAVVASNNDGVITVMNSVAEQLTGWTRVEALGRSVDEVVRVESRQRRPGPQRAVLVTRRGERLDVSFSEAAVLDGGALCGNVRVLRDVSAEVRARRELEREHQQLQAMSEAIPDDVCTVGLAGQVSWHKGRGLLGGVSGDAMSALHTAWGEEIAARLQAAVRQVVASRELQVIEFATSRPGRGLESFEARVVRIDESSACVLVRDVTRERRRATELRAHQESLDSILTATAAIVYSARLADRRVEYVSGSIQRILGFSPADAVSPDFWVRRLHPDDRERVLSSLDRLSAEGSQVREYRHEHRDGGYRWLRDEVRVVYDENGTPRRAIGASFDVTARKHDEARLRSILAVQGQIGHLSHRILTRQSELVGAIDEGLTQLGRALEAPRVYILGVEAAGLGVVHDWTAGDAARRPLGDISTADLEFLIDPLRRGVPHFVRGERGAGEGDRARSVLAAWGVDALVLAPIARHGHLDGVLVIEDPGLEVLSEQDHGALLVLFGDIVGAGVDQRRVEQKLQRLTGELEQLVAARGRELEASERRFATMFEYAPQALLVVDRGGCIRQVNARATDLFGWPADVLRGRSIEVLIPDADRKAHATHVREFCGTPRAMLEGRAVTAIRSNGAPFAAEIGLVPLELDGERVVLAGVVDVSGRVAAERSIAASLREKETLLREIHHRVKNNLQIVASLLQLQAAVAGEDVRQVLVESVFRVRSMAMVHEHLYGTDSLAAVELTTFVRRLVEMVRIGLGSGARVLVDGGPVTVSVDIATPMGLIITELVTNALKYGVPHHAVQDACTWDVRVSVEADACELKVEVADRGAGLSQPLDLLAEATLGLRLVRALSRQLHGHLEVIGELGVSARIAVPLERTKVGPS